MIYPIQKRITVTLDQSASLTPPIDLEGRVLEAISLSNSWAAAQLTLQASLSASNHPWTNVYVDFPNTVYALNVDESMHILISNNLRGVPFMKLRSGTPAAPVAQPNTVTFVLFTVYRS